MSGARNLPADTDLSHLFGIEMAGTAQASLPSPVSELCPKCRGKGKFVGYTGRVVGNCFACNGSGLAHNAGKAVADGDCPKCCGTGEWRPGRPCFACNGTGKPVAAIAVDVSKIAAAFETARSKGIKTPRLRLDGVTFSRAPDHGANAGAVYVKGNGGTYLGKVVSGEFKRSRDCTDDDAKRIAAVASDPDGAARAYGLKVGRCSCCGLTLTNGESVRLGIGPICREKWGWS